MVMTLKIMFGQNLRTDVSFNLKLIRPRYHVLQGTYINSPQEEKWPLIYWEIRFGANSRVLSITTYMHCLAFIVVDYLR